MYGIGGGATSPRPRSTTSRLQGARPVRIGNGAFDQRQNDVFGAVLDSVLLHTNASRPHAARLWPLVRAQVEAAAKGVARARPGHLGGARRAAALRISKIMCWVAMDRGAQLAAIRGEPDLEASWRTVADEIQAEILEKGVSERGVFASTTTPTRSTPRRCWPRSGFLPADDPRLRATVLAIADELTEHGLVLRYKVDETDDGLSGKEGTFLICSFWLVSALTEIGEKQRAKELCERLLPLASPLGLYAEEFEADTGRHLGNFPQAFTHLALLEATSRIVLADRLAEMSL